MNDGDDVVIKCPPQVKKDKQRRKKKLRKRPNLDFLFCSTSINEVNVRNKGRHVQQPFEYRAGQYDHLLQQEHEVKEEKILKYA